MTQNLLVLQSQPAKQNAAGIRYSFDAQWSGDQAARGKETLWYEVGPTLACPEVTPLSAEQCLIAYLFDAMRTNTDIHVGGQVSARLLENLTEYQQAWHKLRPRQYRPIQISAEEITNAVLAQDDRTAIAPFSGGLDSSYTVWSHFNQERGHQNRRIVGTFLAHGFDIPIDKPEEFAKAYASAKLSMESLGIPLLAIRTNYRQIIRTSWEDTHPAALVSTAYCAQSLSRQLLVPGSVDYRDIDWGSNPATDPLLSSGMLRVIHDGAGATLPQKAKTVAGWEAGYARLRVCYQYGKGTNCGHCTNCVRRKIYFAANGIEPPPSLGRPLTGKSMKVLIRLRSNYAYITGQDAIQTMRENGIRPNWLTAMRFFLFFAKLRIKIRRLRNKSI